MIQHTCLPGTACNKCRVNMSRGYPPNHPQPAPGRRTNRSTTTAPTAQPPQTPTCVHLGAPVRVLGSTRKFQQCTNGFGSTTEDARKGLVVQCSTCPGNTGSGVWQVGRECGPTGCPGFKAPPETLAGPPAADLPTNRATTPLALPSPKSLKWSYGITTIPERVGTTLPGTIASLRAAGFDTPHLFCDGAANLESFQLPYTVRGVKVRAFVNWMASLWELYGQNPSADRYALFQDDVVSVTGLRAYLEATPWQPKTYLNLYTWGSNYDIRPTPDHVGWFKSNQLGKGALGLVFDRDTVIELLGSKRMAQRPLNVHRGHRSIDGGISTTLTQLGWTELVHSPSLLQHTGKVSSIKAEKPYVPTASFPGETYDVFSQLAPV